MKEAIEQLNRDDIYASYTSSAETYELVIIDLKHITP